MRKASSNWLGKTIMSVVMGLLIIAFGFWGIADIFKGFGQSTLATIGRTEISINEFRQLYTDKLQQIGRQFGRPLTMDQARAFGLDRQLLQQTIAEAALDEEARRLGLGQSDAEIMRMVSASDIPSPIRRASSSSAASAMVCCSTWRSRPKARAWSIVSGRPNWRPICCSFSV